MKVNYCAHCGNPIKPTNEENGVYVNLLMVKLFCEDCGRTTFIRWGDRIRR
jgi:hypothetical protein